MSSEHVTQGTPSADSQLVPLPGERVPTVRVELLPSETHGGVRAFDSETGEELHEIVFLRFDPFEPVIYQNVLDASGRPYIDRATGDVARRLLRVVEVAGYWYAPGYRPRVLDIAGDKGETCAVCTVALVDGVCPRCALETQAGGV